MVTKITLFEPHFDGAQLGSATIGAAVDGEEENEHKTRATTTAVSKLPTGSRPPVRLLLGLGMVIGGIAAAAIIIRRRKQHGTAQASETEADATIEARAVEGLTAE